MDASDIQRFSELDATLKMTEEPLKPLHYAEPLNGAEQKAVFLASASGDPAFAYRPIGFDDVAIEIELRAMDIPDTPVGRLYRGKRNMLLADLDAIRSRGDRERMIEATSRYHGTPAPDLVEYSEAVLRETPPEEREKRTPASEVKTALERALHDYGLEGWSVMYGRKQLTEVRPDLREIWICETRLFAEDAPRRLAVHEVGVHALRAANGYGQPFRIFATGLPGYLPTEEGLASFAEETTGLLDKELIRDYAGRVLAVDSVVRGDTFRQTFDRLRAQQFTDDQAWNLSVRAHRGGGYVKDHVYLSGLRQVRGYARGGGEIERLYVGKVGLDDLPLVDQLLQDGTLKSPSGLPGFFTHHSP